MLVRKIVHTPVFQILLYCVLGLLFVLAIVLRASLFHVQTSDYNAFLSQWYDYIQNHGGFAALKDNFSNYNVPYLYLLLLATYVPIPKLIAIKLISVLFDGLLSLFTYLLLRLKFERPLIPLIGALVVLFAPTIFVNSAAWGQSDAIYTAFCLGSLYFLLKERPGWACVFFGLAISFKLQAIFFLPVLLVLLLRKRQLLKYLVLIPLMFLLMLVPAYIAGRDAGSLLTIYVGQVNSGGIGVGRLNGVGGGTPNGGGQFNGGNGGFNGGGRGQSTGGNGGFPGGGGNPFGGGGRGRFNGGGGQFSSSSLTLNAPSFYQWLPASAPSFWKWIGIVLAGLFVIFIGALVALSKKEITREIILKIALTFALAIPFLLPEMHERYFYLADVISITYAFYFPRRFYIAVIMQLCSLLSYAPYMLNQQIVSLSYVALGVFVITVITTVDLVFTLFPAWRSKVAGAVVSRSPVVAGEQVPANEEERPTTTVR